MILAKGEESLERKLEETLKGYADDEQFKKKESWKEFLQERDLKGDLKRKDESLETA